MAIAEVGGLHHRYERRALRNAGSVVAYADETRLVLSPAEQWSRHWPMRLSIRPRPSVIMLSLAPLSKS